MPKKIRLGELLVNNKVISQPDLDKAIAIQQKTGGKLGQVLIDENIISESNLLKFLSDQLNLPLIDLNHFEFESKITSLLPETYARRFRAIGLSENQGVVQIGMADPLDLFAQDELRRLLHVPIEIVLVSEQDLLRSLDLVYRRIEEVEDFAEELDDQIEQSDLTHINLATIVEAEANTPVAKLLRSLFEDAVQIGASDIHIEPDEKQLRIRQRVDGVLQEHIVPESRVAAPLALKLKLMANLNISEKRTPQDGRFNITVKNKSIDIRLSTLPTQYGESVVMRLLDQGIHFETVEQLVMPGTMTHDFRRLIHLPYGMMLVTGPTGSGKTTTLYSALAELNTPEVKIITAEDPIEYRLSRVNQVQVNPKVGLTFANVLRTMMRQDPDIILVGEIRDKETADIAIRAALTGHLVLATLHTNDAASTAIRLMDMGLPGFIVAAALRGVLAQRLVRKICRHCKATYQFSVQERAWIEKVEPTLAESDFFQGSGCARCHKTGFSGRIGVYELLTLDEQLTSALRNDDTEKFIQLAKRNTQSLAYQALRLAAEGTTTISEVLRVAGDSGTT